MYGRNFGKENFDLMYFKPKKGYCLDYLGKGCEGILLNE